TPPARCNPTPAGASIAVRDGCGDATSLPPILPSSPANTAKMAVGFSCECRDFRTPGRRSEEAHHRSPQRHPHQSIPRENQSVVGEDLASSPDADADINDDDAALRSPHMTTSPVYR